MSDHNRGLPALTPDVTRRTFLQATGLAGFSAFLAACGTTGSGTQAPGGSGAAAGDKLNFANWIGYMDVSEDGNSFPTLDEFRAASGIEVNYSESIDDNETFFTSDLRATAARWPSTPVPAAAGR